MIKILVIDDEESLRSIASAYLEAEGYTVHMAEGGQPSRYFDDTGPISWCWILCCRAWMDSKEFAESGEARFQSGVACPGHRH